MPKTFSKEKIGKEINKLIDFKEHINMLIDDYFVNVILFDSWYAKNPIIKNIQERNFFFISRARSNNVVLLNEKKIQLKKFAEAVPHTEYELFKINDKNYWVYEKELIFKTYGSMRVILSKEGVYDEPIFLITNSKFSSQFVVKLYLKRFAIEIFLKDAKQFLNFETFLCRNAQKWKLHLQLINILH